MMDAFKLSLVVWGICSLGLGAVKAQNGNSHRLERLSTADMRTVAGRSDTYDAKAHFKNTLLVPMLIERVVDTAGSAQVQQHIRSTMESYRWTVEEDRFSEETPDGVKNFVNIIATLNPTAPRKLVFVCHHDSKKFTNFEFIGATDSAVSCAMMMDMAYLYNSTLSDPENIEQSNVTWEFWFLDGKESFQTWTETDSLYGSRHLADKLENENAIDKVDAMVLLSLIGTATTTFRKFPEDTKNFYERLQKIENRLSQASLLSGRRQSLYFPNDITRGQGIADDHRPFHAKEDRLSQASLLSGQRQGLYFPKGITRGQGIADDHRPFLEKGVSALALISYPFPLVWHKESDVEAALDYDTINDIGKILRVFVAEYLHINP